MKINTTLTLVKYDDLITYIFITHKPEYEDPFGQQVIGNNTVQNILIALYNCSIPNSE